MMLLKDAYKKAAEIISVRSEDALFDSMCLTEKVFGIDRTGYYLRSDEEISDEKYEELIGLAQRRASGEPLQYILGKWEFMGRSFFVGEGVLIPRPETEMIVETALDFLKDKKAPVIIDLCSGSGCIGISVAAERKDSKVYLIEKSEAAFLYLEKNIRLNGVPNAVAVRGDIFTDADKFDSVHPDVILSNPPYIESDTVAGLQSEVLREPLMALDGGKDGLDFYRAIADFWIPLLGKGGAVIAECGENQAESICSIFEKSKRVKSTDFKLDYCGNERMVTANTES